MTKDSADKDLLAIINQALNRQGISAREASIRATGTPELIRNMRRGSVPSVERFRALCKVLKLEFYVGPEQLQKSPAMRAANDKDVLYNMFQEVISRLPPKSTRVKTAEPNASYGFPKSDDIYHIPPFETSGIAGKNMIAKGERIASYVAFQGSWLYKHNLDPKHCVIAQVCDEAMEPTIPNHAVVLVDRLRCRRLVGHIYAINIDDNLTLRRFVKNKNEWQLVGDHPKYKTIPLSDSVEVLGEVKWTAKTLE